MDSFRPISEDRTWHGRLRKFRFVSSFLVAVTFTIVGAIIGFVEMVAITALASVVPGPRAIAYLMDGHYARDGSATSRSSDQAIGKARAGVPLGVLIGLLALGVMLVLVAAWLWGALVAAVCSLGVYYSEFLIAREMQRMGKWRNLGTRSTVIFGRWRVQRLREDP